MCWQDQVREKIKRKNQILFSKDCEFLQDLATVINNENHRVIVLWALELAQQTAQKLHEKYPHNTAALDAVKSARLWASGVIKMPIAKTAILNCHAFAKEISSQEDIALCHAVAQGCSVVHTPGHAMGYPIYELTALVRRYGIDNCAWIIEKRKGEYIQRLIYWRNNYDSYKGGWAKFMLR